MLKYQFPHTSPGITLTLWLFVTLSIYCVGYKTAVQSWLRISQLRFLRVTAALDSPLYLSDPLRVPRPPSDWVRQSDGQCRVAVTEGRGRWRAQCYFQPSVPAWEECGIEELRRQCSTMRRARGEERKVINKEGEKCERETVISWHAGSEMWQRKRCSITSVRVPRNQRQPPGDCGQRWSRWAASLMTARQINVLICARRQSIVITHSVIFIARACI